MLALGAPREQPWFWGLEFYEWQGSDGPQYGNVADLDAAKAAFRKAWERRPQVRSSPEMTQHRRA
jgi:hypothetical protein